MIKSNKRQVPLKWSPMDVQARSLPNARPTTEIRTWLVRTLFFSDY